MDQSNGKISESSEVHKSEVVIWFSYCPWTSITKPSCVDYAWHVSVASVLCLSKLFSYKLTEYTVLIVFVNEQ